MPRPSQADDQRAQLLPVVARTFAELGYRRTTTAELARRCEVRENILYRLWQDKKAMFRAAIEHVYDHSTAIWSELPKAAARGQSAAERLLEYESEHHGEFGLYRIVFAGLTETDDPEIRKTLRRFYVRFQRFVRDRVVEHRGGRERTSPEPEAAAWATVGLGTVSYILRELRILPLRERKRIILSIGSQLLGERRR